MVSNNRDFRSLQVLFYAMLIGQLLFMLVVIFLVQNGEMGERSHIFGENEDLIIAGVYVMVMIGLSRFIDGMWKKQIPTVQRVNRSAFGHYRNTVILRLAILEGAGLLTIVLALVTSNPTLFLATALGLMAFWLARPAEEEFTERYDEPLPA
ncbi:MAG: hypothetical protein AAF597_12125 [Bacteroidota bacterium]